MPTLERDYKDLPPPHEEEDSHRFSEGLFWGAVLAIPLWALIILIFLGWWTGH